MNTRKSPLFALRSPLIAMLVAAVGPLQRDKATRKLAWIGVLAVLTGLAGGTARAQDHDTTLASLQGSYEAKSIGFTTVCTNSGGCSAASPTLVQFNSAAVAQATVDDHGNFCATSTSATAPVTGSAAGAIIGARTIAGSITSFNAATQQGDLNLSIYKGGSCNGASFDSTGATLAATATGHLVVSEAGNRIDALTTSYVSEAGIIGSVVDTVTLHRQR